MAVTTFLFTDIEGSTRLWEAHPQAMEDALRAHDELITAAIDKHGGDVFKHTGDGVAAAFDSAAPAVEAAAHIQREMAEHPHPDVGPMKLRIGIHSGEATQRDGDYFGHTLNRVARLTGAANGGQVLVSLVTERLLEGTDLTLRDLGPHRLRDLGRSERIFQLVADDLPDRFPPLSTLDEAPNNLPILTTSFVGRDQELAEVEKLVREARLVTLTGVGGSGKTRVALQAAAELSSEFSDGIWLVELGAITNPDFVDSALINALGLGQPSGKTLREAALEHLSHQTTLLVVDNCEHLIGAAAELIQDILTHARDSRVIATSRELLGIPGEVAYGLRSMSLPRQDAQLDTIASSDAVRLFVERAGAARPDFRLTTDNAGAVMEICRRLDGMPLAIELAAARLRTFSPSQIVEHLDQRFRLLTGGSRTALPRQQTLTAAIEWSYRLLSESEQKLFRRVSVFQGGFSFQAVVAICLDDQLDVLGVLPNLVDKSLVVADEEGGEVRYRLLETIRQFARDRLDETGTGDEVRRRHAQYFREFVEEAERHVIGPDEETWWRRARAEFDNLRQALTWSLGAGERATALALAVGFARFSTFEERWSEALSWMRQALPLADEAIPVPLRAEALRWHGLLLHYSPGHDDAAVAELERAIALLRELDADGGAPEDLYGLPRALIMLAVVLFRQGRAGEENEIFTDLVQEALEVARRIGDETAAASALSNLAHHMDPHGDPAQARRLFAEAEQAHRALGSRAFLGSIFSQRAYFEFEQRQFEQARRYWMQSIDYQPSDRTTFALESRACVAACEVEMGDESAAERFVEVVRELFERQDVRESVTLHQTLLALRAGIDAHLERYQPVAIAAGASEAESAHGIAVRWDLVEHFGRAKHTAREALGQEAYDAARAEGAAMSHDQVTDFLAAR